MDVQLPYRLPYECLDCGNCKAPGQQRDIVRAVQRAQDAQTGYCADYCAKNQPMAFHEIREFQKGHQQLQQTYQGDNIDKLGKRHVTRFLSDAYCKGIVRGQVECCNLRAYNKPSSVVAAERMSTAAFWSFPGRAYLQAVNTAFDEGDELATRPTYVWTPKGPAGQRQMREMDPAQVYGHRPQEDGMWYLSPYEFGVYWECMPMRAPTTRGEWKEQRSSQWDVTLTKKGEAKIAAAATDETPVRLLAGVDFERLPKTEKSKKVFFDSSAGRVLQHGWYLCQRLRPLCPHMASAPVPSKWGDDVERNAKLTLTYFKAWTLNKKRDSDAVPYVRRLREPQETWEDALRHWLLRLPCEETKRYVGNFLSVYRVRPDNEGENSDDEDDATELVVTPEKLVEACQTQVPLMEGESKKGKWASHRNLIVEAMEQANRYWKESASGQRPRVNPWEGADSKTLLKGVRRKTVEADRRQRHCDLVVEPHVQHKVVDIASKSKEIKGWAAGTARAGCNAKQADVCNMVAQQIVREMPLEAGETAEPLRWAVHGGPGTGKSYVLNLIRKELFETLLGWKQGEEFQVVTLQAVMAENLNGDTIHHAFGLNWQGAGDERISPHKLLDLSMRALRWRWLIIDEISMVSAELLSRLELRCRELVRDLAPSKYAAGEAHARPFGGLNVILAGDLWQLPPPRGTFLGDVPWEWLTQSKTKKVAHTIHGQELVWGTLPKGMQGVTQLTECERTRDAWLRNLQDEIRNGALSSINHAFLHGFETPVPGSWNGHRLECENVACKAMLQRKMSGTRIQQMECDVCHNERASKVRVVDDAGACKAWRKPEQFLPPTL